MSYTLNETLRQIDPFVNLSNGSSVLRACEWLELVNPSDVTEYILCVDSIGRLMIHRVDFAGYMVFPPEFVEQKKPAGHHAPLGYSPQSYPRPPRHYV